MSSKNIQITSFNGAFPVTQTHTIKLKQPLPQYLKQILPKNREQESLAVIAIADPQDKILIYKGNPLGMHNQMVHRIFVFPYDLGIYFPLQEWTNFIRTWMTEEEATGMYKRLMYAYVEIKKRVHEPYTRQLTCAIKF